MVSRKKLGESLNLETDLIPKSNSNRPGTAIKPLFITIHNTDNPGQGADARAHALYVKGAAAQSRKVSWHYTVDDKRCIKHLPINEIGWHAGSGAGNSQSIGIEICMNQGIDQEAANRRAATLAAILMYDLGIPLDKVVTHQHWTGKQCPRLLLADWPRFRGEIQGIYRSIEPQPEAIAELFADASLFSGHGQESLGEIDESDTDSEKLEYPAFCSLPIVPERLLQENIDPNRASFALLLGKKWVNRTVLHYCFLDSPSSWRGEERQKQAVRQAFTTWKNVDIGLEFVEVKEPSEAEIRIGFEGLVSDRGRSWSYVGRDAIDLVPNPRDRTMNFGWDLTTPYGGDTALHEIGHALGLIHEHQNPQAGIVWNEANVRSYYSGPPNNWRPEEIEHNILNKVSPELLQSSDWDKDSIMQYWIEAGLIISPPGYENRRLIPKPGLSTTDIEEIRRFYPGTPPVNRELQPYSSAVVDVAPGEQMDFVIYPPETRPYTIQMIGDLDTVIVLFEERDGVPRYVDGNDDSGFDKNARILSRLVKGKTYYLRVRVYYTGTTGKGAVILF